MDMLTWKGEFFQGPIPTQRITGKKMTGMRVISLLLEGCALLLVFQYIKVRLVNRKHTTNKSKFQ